MGLTGQLDATRSLRLRLWEALAGKRIQVAWYEGLRLELVLGNDLSRALYAGGTVDPNEFAFLAALLRPGMTVIDVGANEGLYSVFASRRVGPMGQVIAIEPSLRESARIERNCALNRINNVRIRRLALSDSERAGVLNLADPRHTGHNSLGQFLAPHIRSAGQQPVELVRLDQLVFQEQLASIDVVKIDVEGAELAVLRGGEKTLLEYRPVLMLEFTEETLADHGASTRKIVEFLEGIGYELFEFSATTGEIVPVFRTVPTSVNIVAKPREA